MSAILFINGGSKKFGNDFREACANSGIDCMPLRTLHTAFHVHDGKVDVYTKERLVDLTQFSYAFIRVRAKTPYTASVLMKLIESYNIPSNDPVIREHTDANGKLMQMMVLTRAGIAVPETWLCNGRSFKANEAVILPTVFYPCVLKIPGSQGRAVWKIDSEEELRMRIKSLSVEFFMIQRYVPNQSDIRVLCMYGECIGAIQRSATDGFYNNISHGGAGDVIEITPQEKDISIRVCKAIGVDFGGVDIVRTPDGPLIFEVNCGPQVYGFETATGMQVGRILVDKIAKQFLKS